MRMLTAAFVLLALPVSAAPARRAPTVHVTTAGSAEGLQDVESRARQEAVANVTRRLPRFVRLVATDTADVQVVVTSVQTETVWWPNPYASARPLRPGETMLEGTRPSTVARATLTRGSYSTTFAEAASGFRTNAGDNLARAVAAWFSQNEAALTR